MLRKSCRLSFNYFLEIPHQRILVCLALATGLQGLRLVLCLLVKEWYNFLDFNLNWHPGKKFLKHKDIWNDVIWGKKVVLERDRGEEAQNTVIRAKVSIPEDLCRKSLSECTGDIYTNP